MRKKSRTGNLGKPLSASKVRGLMRALISLSPSPVGARPRTEASSAAPARAYSPEEIANLASRIRKRAEAGKEVRLTPATAKLVSDALVRMNAVPSNQQLLEIICGGICGFRSDNHDRFCFQCHGRANKLMILLRGERERGVG